MNRDKKFDDALHTLTLSEDGSYTAYSKEYDEHYHSTKDGALNESLLKHVLPTFALKEKQSEITILDICFGLGFNTLATLYYHKQNTLGTKLKIYSPELDAELIASLVHFQYPEEFQEFRAIVESLSRDGVYEDENLYIELFIGDAREYVRRFEERFDIVYQDAFSPSANPALWTQEYFADIAKAMKKDGILSTYSIALKTRLALYENGFYIFLSSGENIRKSTLASRLMLEQYTLVDMEHKIACNPLVRSLRDSDV